MSPRKMTLPLIAILSLIAGFFAVSHSISQQPDAEVHAEPVPRQVRVARVEEVDRPRQLSFSGVTRATQRARLAFSLGGRLLERGVEIGDRVHAGQTLARLDGREPRNAVATARATLSEREAYLVQNDRDQARVARLVEAKAATREELEQASAAADALRAAVEAARARLHEAERVASESRLVAPFSGTVTQVMQEPGEVLQPGQSVLILSGEVDLELEVEVPESLILQIHAGDRVEAILPAAAPGEKLGGTIHSVGRSVVGVGGLFPVVARFDADSRLVAGMTAELLIGLKDASALAIPVEAVINPGGRQPSVYRLKEGLDPFRVERVEVEVLHLLDDRVTVRGPLKAGDRVVAAGQHALLDGDRVEISR